METTKVTKKLKHTEEKAVNSLRKKQDVYFDGNVISIKRGKKATQDLGNGSWGKIDFLCNHKGYIQVFVD